MDADPTEDEVPPPGSGRSTSAMDVPSPPPADGTSQRSLALARRFAEQLVAEAVESAHDASSQGEPVNWQAIWAAGGGASSPERVVGRIVLAASHVARTISGIPALVENEATPLVGPGTERTSTGPGGAPPTLARGGNEAAAGAGAAVAAGAGAAFAAGVEAGAGADSTDPPRLGASQRLSARPSSAPPASPPPFVPPGPTPPFVPPAPPPPAAESPVTPAPTQSLPPWVTPAPAPSPPPWVTPVPAPSAPPQPPPPVTPASPLPRFPQPDVPERSGAGSDDPLGTARGETHRRRRRRRLTRTFAWVRNIAAVVILFAAWQVWGTALLEHHSQSQLAVQFDRAGGTSPSDDRPFGLLSGTRRVAVAPEGSVIARLRIPAIGVDQFVVEGTATGDLEKGPGHYMGTAVPGQAGNVAVAGHRTTFGGPFNRLDELGPGDTMTLTTTAGETLVYTVSRLPRIVSSSNVAILNDFGDDRLTLTSSNPKYSAADRLVVVAVLDQPSPTSPAGTSAATAPAPVAGPPPGRLVDTQTAGWNPRRLGPAGGIAALLLLLALAYRRPAPGRRLLSVLILGPVWIVGLALLFLALTNVLPSTL